jgi:UDPglucose 6-dehydrogenase
VWCENAFEAAAGADVLVVVTEWNEFRALDLEDIKQQMAGKTIVDLRNVFDPDTASDLGLTYSGIGRGQPQSTTGEHNSEAGQAGRQPAPPLN